MRTISASRVVSAVGGSVSQPVAGRTRLHIFLSKTISRVISKLFDETADLMALGYSCTHWEGLRIPFFRSDCKTT